MKKSTRILNQITGFMVGLALAVLLVGCSDEKKDNSTNPAPSEPSMSTPGYTNPIPG